MNNINFTVKHVKLIADDIIANLHSQSSLQSVSSGFDNLSIQQRELAVAQLLNFFNCPNLYELSVRDGGVEDIAANILQNIEQNLKICFTTSGSTGQPVWHKHSIFSLQAEVMAFAEHLPSIKRVISVVPRYHLYGCSFAFLMPIILGIPVKQVSLLAIPSIMEELQAGDLLVGFPLFWLHLSELGHKFKQKIYGLTSTGPCPPKVFDQLQILGLNKFYEIYGSSEAGATGIRNHYSVPFRLLSHWRKLDEQTLLRANAADGHEKITLPDNITWIDNTTFELIERLDKAVQVGGINVYPRQISKIIEDHPSVKLCRVRLMDEDEGNRLKAFIVPAEKLPTIEGLRRQLITWCKQRLAPAQRPRSFTFGNTLPVNQLGKEANWSIKPRL